MRFARVVAAFFTASARTAASYRLAQLVAVAGLAFAVVPLFLVGTKLQPMMGGVVRGEGGAYFPFLLVGNAVLMLMVGALNAPAGAVGGTVGSGTLEAMLATPTSLGAIVAGLCAYPVFWASVRMLVLLAAGALLGVAYVPSGIPAALVFAALTAAAYAGIGLFEAAIVLAFRTSTPVPKAVLVVSVLLGGVYFPTSSAPSWLQGLTVVTPLGYGLRGIRRVLLAGDAPASVLPEFVMLGCMAAATLAFGAMALSLALQRARRAGTLGSF